MHLHNPTPSHQDKAFTLIELLTVIAIIGILAAIMIPTVGAVRRKAHQSTSVSNMRQISVALYAYAADNKDLLPYSWGWLYMASPASLRSQPSTVPDRLGCNELGYLVYGGYLGTPAGDLDFLTSPRKPKVLRTVHAAETFFDPATSTKTSYYYESPYMLASGSTNTSKPNLISELVSAMAIVIESAQHYSGFQSAYGENTPVLYGGGQVKMRPWNGQDGLSLTTSASHFDTAENLRD